MHLISKPLSDLQNFQVAFNIDESQYNYSTMKYSTKSVQMKYNAGSRQSSLFVPQVRPRLRLVAPASC